MIDCVRILLSKHGWLFLLLLGLSGWPSPASAMTGNEWRALPIAARTTYVTGVVDNLVDWSADRARRITGHRATSGGIALTGSASRRRSEVSRHPGPAEP